MVCSKSWYVVPLVFPVWAFLSWCSREECGPVLNGCSFGVGPFCLCIWTPALTSCLTWCTGHESEPQLALVYRRGEQRRLCPRARVAAALSVMSAQGLGTALPASSARSASLRNTVCIVHAGEQPLGGLFWILLYLKPEFVFPIKNDC